VEVLSLSSPRSRSSSLHSYLLITGAKLAEVMHRFEGRVCVLLAVKGLYKYRLYGRGVILIPVPVQNCFIIKPAAGYLGLLPYSVYCIYYRVVHVFCHAQALPSPFVIVC